MKNKKTIIVILSIIIIISLGTLLIYNIIKTNNIKKENINIIKTSYNNLTVEVKEYNKIREKYNNMLSNFIYDEYSNQHEDYIDILTKYNEVIKKIDT